jgi:hypothetical protein
MVTTTLSVLALAAALNASPSPATGMHTDYAQALTIASAERKPMAVLIGHGGDKVKQMLADGTIPTESARLLRESYVFVYLDTETGAGKELAGRFQIPEGLVISSPGGSVQALRHNGAIAGTDLTRQLGQFASAGQPVATVSSGIGAAPVATGYTIVTGGCPNGNCPLTTYSYPFGGSSCPNGRCPNQR